MTTFGDLESLFRHAKTLFEGLEGDSPQCNGHLGNKRQDGSMRHCPQQLRSRDLLELIVNKSRQAHPTKHY